ncbi:Protein kinase superfamily protein [Klebsormidium nitens]|uniref:Protein kinase superfamily protein n=1 Tax=Klebsormidium nitens TaxID=105231 RepID=A0A1Y1I9A8_KLENI|nr:Protein kinase superfamily protein [Klebsormidium nitens]|eukprot:GAQ87133.1 Protein kinase superfamily protein [Klebsormidium nitens]
MSRPAVVLQDVASKEEHRLPLYYVEEMEGQVMGHLSWDCVLKAFKASEIEIEGKCLPSVFKSGIRAGLTRDWFHSGTVVKVNVEKEDEWPQLIASGLDSFRGLLKQAHVTCIDPEVMETIARHLPWHMLVAYTPGLALDLYERAQLIPGESTRTHLLAQHGVRVGGPFFWGNWNCAYTVEDWSPSLLQGVDRQGRPRVVKFLRASVPSDGSEQPGGSEARACRALLPEAKWEGIPLIDAEVLELTLPEMDRSTDRPPGRYAVLVCQQYCVSVASILQLPEVAIEREARSMITALSYMHNKGLVHMDVKSENVFIDADGRWFLGDFGSTVPVGAPVVSTTRWFTAFDLFGSPAKEEYDWYMLAVMLAVELDKDDWRDRLIVGSHTPPAKLVAALQVAKSPTLLNLIKEILQLAGVSNS